MRILIAVFKDLLIFFNPKNKLGKRRLGALAGLFLVTLVGYQFLAGTGEEENTAAATPTEVSVLSAAELGAKASFDTVGKVEAVSEANLQTEASGRITSVTVNVGDQVGAGAIIASIENNAERASLVQAQGSYEAALALSAQTGVGVNESQTGLTAAKNAAVNVFRQTNNSVNSAIRNNIDSFFSNPESSLPGLRLDGRGSTDTFNTERVAYQQILPEFQNRSNTISVTSKLESELQYAKTQVERTISFVDLFIAVLNREANGSRYSEAELQSLNSNFTALRASLIGTRTSIDAALAGLASAEDAVRRAELAASGGQVSASNAQVKIALGALQAAQASYQKTIVRSPISGVVNALYLKTGDYAAPGQPAAIIANNSGLQVKTFVSEIDSANLNVGDAVTIEGGASGVITAKAAALDPSNGKVAVVVGVNPDSELTNGATVKLTFSQITESTTADRILVPLSALKISASGTLVFTVNEQNELVAVPVTQGQLYGDNIELTSGVTRETRIVTDARGLKEGQKVTVK